MNFIKNIVVKPYFRIWVKRFKFDNKESVLPRCKIDKYLKEQDELPF